MEWVGFVFCNRFCNVNCFLTFSPLLSCVSSFFSSVSKLSLLDCYHSVLSLIAFVTSAVFLLSLQVSLMLALFFLLSLNCHYLLLDCYHSVLSLNAILISAFHRNVYFCAQICDYRHVIRIESFFKPTFLHLLGNHSELIDESCTVVVIFAYTMVLLRYRLKINQNIKCKILNKM